jgi:microcin C transport system substrate-binding protein
MLLSAEACAEEGWKHGSALFGELKYGPDFSRYEHVDPQAPKGGTLNQAVNGGFDSFNPFVVRGRPAAGLDYTGGLLWETLMEQSVDQHSASYGLLAEAFRHAPDHSAATYRLNPGARFHDGSPVTPEDVIWSLEVLKANQPLYSQYYRNVVKAEKTGEREVTFTFDVKGNRELPHIMGDLPVLPKAWWEGTGADGRKRNIAEPVSEPPLGSGPYRIGAFDMGKSIVWERVADYWGTNLPVRRGRYNFDRIRYTYFLDDTAVWESFKKGGIADTHGEYVSRRWASEYNFPAIERGDVLRKSFPQEGPETFQAYFFNLRNPKFADIRVRKALTLLFDFETMNKNLFFGLYRRTDSYFEGGELQSQGKAAGREREILEAYRGRVDAEAIDGEFRLPVYGDATQARSHQREALRLLGEAGYRNEGGKLLDPAGKPFEIEILGDGPVDERVGIPTVAYFAKAGIKARLRIVDDAQYKNRLDNFDFEMTMRTIGQSLSPGNEQREFWSSKAAGQSGSRNFSGIADPVVDELVERIIQAPDRAELVALTRALDRVLLAGHYAIPMWHNPDVWFAWWKKLRFPPNQPKANGIDLYSAWIDTDTEKAMEGSK